MLGGADTNRPGQQPEALQLPAATLEQDDGRADSLQHLQEGSEIDIERSAH
jgi:hypothetical protein